MRNWVRERMRRRGKKSKNESESTGKVGQEKPPVTADQPAPLQPSYYAQDDEAPARVHAPEISQPEPPELSSERMQIVTQPESPSMPPASVLVGRGLATHVFVWQTWPEAQSASCVQPAGARHTRPTQISLEGQSESL